MRQLYVWNASYLLTGIILEIQIFESKENRLTFENASTGTIHRRNAWNINNETRNLKEKGKVNIK